MTDQRISLGYMGSIEAYVNDNIKQTDDFILGVIQEYYTERGYHQRIEINGANLKAMIEKQIPKKAVGVYNNSCPACLGTVVPGIDKYCPECGQKLMRDNE